MRHNQGIRPFHALIYSVPIARPKKEAEAELPVDEFHWSISDGFMTLPSMLVLLATTIFLILERAFPGRELPKAKGWYCSSRCRGDPQAQARTFFTTLPATSVRRK
jgi:hypothetical protein